MSDEIRLTVTYDRALWRRAMTGWWQSVVPPAPFVKRAIFWAVVWMLIGLLALFVSAFGLTLYLVGGGLIGAAFLIGVFSYLQRTRMSRFWDVVGTHWDRAGSAEIIINVDTITMTDTVERRELAWSAIDAIKPVRGVTVLRTGFSMLAIPDKDLPDGMAQKAFLAQLQQWKNA